LYTTLLTTSTFLGQANLDSLFNGPVTADFQSQRASYPNLTSPLTPRGPQAFLSLGFEGGGGGGERDAASPARSRDDLAQSRGDELGEAADEAAADEAAAVRRLLFALQVNFT